MPANSLSLLLSFCISSFSLSSQSGFFLTHGDIHISDLYSLRNSGETVHTHRYRLSSQTMTTGKRVCLLFQYYVSLHHHHQPHHRYYHYYYYYNLEGWGVHVNGRK
ncbi:hypothetical protein CHARACLAT_022279 [Characodon lateralis]|uniref:Secreted protein n=1 Tax=Characodon lateralis TaxID=208331 RepID=A0ABU7E4J8_9TELE|nr:hypothetical protein [Characodon lateralis]